MSSPLESPEFANLYLGDTKDDDGKVIDSFLVEVDNAPPAADIPLVDTSKNVAPERPTPVGRLFSGTIQLDTSYTTPYQMLPADRRRKHLRMDGYSTFATPGFNDYVYVADENGKVLSALSAWRLRTGKGMTLDDYTGAIFLLPGAALQGAFEVTWVAVTL